MLNGNKHIFEKDLKAAFESGYSNAASSFSKLAQDKIHFNNFHFGFHTLGSKFSAEHETFGRNGGHHLITTEIFGDVTGKSYLFLSEKEFDLLTAKIPVCKDPKVNLKEEFAKEVDNILSASVITRLSNKLNLKMYGDIPVWAGMVNEKIEDIIHADFSTENEEVYINSISFSFENKPVINPVFIWVMNSSVQKVLEANLIWKSVSQ
jgi:chemotaxis protein CheY-P-specific phosphatase CheC